MPKIQGAEAVPQTLYGWGGWLRFFSIQNEVIQPILLVITILPSIVLVFTGELNTSLVLWFLFDVSLRVFLIWFGIKACRALYKRRPGAVRLAQVFIITILIWLATTLSTDKFFADEATKKFVPERYSADKYDIERSIAASQESTIRQMIMRRSLGFASGLFWLLYFARSRRVRATYQPLYPDQLKTDGLVLYLSLGIRPQGSERPSYPHPA
jgi:hypothetical protein